MDLLNYKIINNAKEEILFIPGWNDNINHFQNIANKLKDYKLILIDLPNQGNSKKINKVLYMDDYIKYIEEFIKEHNLNPKIIIGHSFGGKLAYLYARKHKINKLILLAPSLVKNKSFITYIKIYLFKLIKLIKNKFNLKINLNQFGSKDYKNQVGIEKQNFIIATNNYYNKDLKHLNIKTLLYYGKKDKVTPLKEAYYIKNRIKNSSLYIDKYGDHFAVYENPYLFIKILKEFLND